MGSSVQLERLQVRSFQLVQAKRTAVGRQVTMLRTVGLGWAYELQMSKVDDVVVEVDQQLAPLPRGSHDDGLGTKDGQAETKK